MSGIVNRDLNVSQQMSIWQQNYSVLGQSGLIYLAQIPCSMQLMSVASSAFGVSSTCNLGIQIQRFVTGKGLTTIAINGSSLLAITAYSTSGIQLHSVPSVGNSLVQLLAGDNLQIVSSGAGAASYNVSAVLQCLQDFQTQYGLGVGA
jgi:hypothetical protein